MISRLREQIIPSDAQTADVGRAVLREVVGDVEDRLGEGERGGVQLAERVERLRQRGTSAVLGGEANTGIGWGGESAPRWGEGGCAPGC